MRSRVINFGRAPELGFIPFSRVGARVVLVAFERERENAVRLFLGAGALPVCLLTSSVNVKIYL
jgi:hypothetical protein